MRAEGDRGGIREMEGRIVGYSIQFVMDQMLYPQARYFTPNGTFKNSICRNGPWNMSAVAEGSLTVPELAAWH